MIVLRDDLAYIALTRDRKGGPMSDQLRPLMIAVSCPKVTLKGYFGLFSLISALALFACNDHPVEPIDQILSASNRIENRLPAKTKLDFLFVLIKLKLNKWKSLFIHSCNIVSESTDDFSFWI